MADRIDINQVLSQMRALKTQINNVPKNGLQGVAGAVEGASEVGRPKGPGFDAMLAQASVRYASITVGCKLLMVRTPE